MSLKNQIIGLSQLLKGYEGRNITIHRHLNPGIHVKQTANSLAMEYVG